jgi:hypothetical protein
MLMTMALVYGDEDVDDDYCSYVPTLCLDARLPIASDEFVAESNVNSW